MAYEAFAGELIVGYQGCGWRARRKTGKQQIISGAKAGKTKQVDLSHWVIGVVKERNGEMVVAGRKVEDHGSGRSTGSCATFFPFRAALSLTLTQDLISHSAPCGKSSQPCSLIRVTFNFTSGVKPMD